MGSYPLEPARSESIFNAALSRANGSTRLLGTCAEWEPRKRWSLSKDRPTRRAYDNIIPTANVADDNGRGVRGTPAGDGGLFGRGCKTAGRTCCNIEQCGLGRC